MFRGFKIMFVVIVGWYAVMGLLSFVAVPLSGFRDAIHYMFATLPCASLYDPMLVFWGIAALVFETARRSGRGMSDFAEGFIMCVFICTIFTALLTLFGGIATVIIGNGMGHGDTRVINMGCYVIGMGALMAIVAFAGGAYGGIRADSVPKRRAR